MGFILSCSSVYNVDHEYDEKADFTRFRSYDWLPKQSESETKKLSSDEFENLVDVKSIDDITNRKRGEEMVSEIEKLIEEKYPKLIERLNK